MHQFNCLHCGTRYAPGQLYCEECDKPLPGTAQHAPAGAPATAAASMMAAARGEASGELATASKKASGALLLVAILQLIVAGIIYAGGAAATGTKVAPVNEHGVAAVVAGIGVVFFGLYAWAKHQPLAAAIVGLLLYVGLHVADAMVDPTALFRGIVIKVIVVAALFKAINAGLRYRDLMSMKPAA